MADTKITALTAITTVDPAVDVLPIVDVSDTSMAASGTTKKITSNQILGAGGTATLASATVTGNATAAAFIPSGSTVPTNGTYLPSANTVGWAVNSTNAMTLNSTGLLVGTSATSYGAAGRGLVVAGGSTSAIIGMRVGSTDTGYIFADATKVELGGNGAVPIVINNAGAAVTIDTSRNVGIGVTPSASWFTGARVLQFGATGAIVNNGLNNSIFSNNAVIGNSGSTYIASSAASYYAQTTGAHIFYTAPSGTAGNAITWTQAMTLDASGNLLLAKTAVSQTTLGFMAEAAGTVTSTLASSTTGSTFNVYSTGAAAYRFYVGMNGTISATNTTISAISDARLKENVQDIDVGLGAILALKPRKFDWKAGKGKDIKGDRGFIAQEFEQVFPQLVDEWKDAAPEGEAPYKSVRQDLIPVLVKAIQELTARVQTLETR